jgi:hypothetical protein
MGSVILPIFFYNNQIEFKMDAQTSEANYQLSKLISSANPSQVDAIWAILKYREMGILRKVNSILEVLQVEKNPVIKELPVDKEGRVLDFKTRTIIHEALISSQ